MNTDERFMRLAIQLARKAEGLTNPNPAVGAVIVKDDKVIGGGYHKRCGLPHAEVNALKAAASKARGATLYVTLEPCDHFGMTPPCTEAVINSGIKKVVIGSLDPNPITNGKGVRALKKRGIKVVTGVLEEEARALNRPFSKFIVTGIPYVTLKMAESLDGKIATVSGDSRWISSDESRRFVHTLRGRVDAVMVGVNTVIRDDPLLLSKIRGAKQPSRVIVDSGLKTPLDAKVLSSARRSPVYIATAKDLLRGKVSRYEKRRARILSPGLFRGHVDLKELLKELGRLGIMHVMAEGGGTLAAALIERHLVDEFLFFIAPKIIGGIGAITSVEGDGVQTIKAAMKLTGVTVNRIADDILIRGYA